MIWQDLPEASSQCRVGMRILKGVMNRKTRSLGSELHPNDLLIHLSHSRGSFGFDAQSSAIRIFGGVGGLWLGVKGIKLKGFGARPSVAANWSCITARHVDAGP